MQETFHNNITVHIGNRTSQRRRELKISLEILSVQSGITIADLHRIEEGAATITAVQLFNLVHALNVSVSCSPIIDPCFS